MRPPRLSAPVAGCHRTCAGTIAQLPRPMFLPIPAEEKALHADAAATAGFRHAIAITRGD